MNKFIFCIIFAFILPQINGSSESSEEASSHPTMYVKMFCQTGYVIERKLIPLNDTENGYKMFVDDVTQVNCERVLKKCSDEIFKELSKEMKKKNYNKKTIKCNVHKMKDSGYDKIRFKTNSLFGLNLNAQQKSDFRTLFNNEIAVVVENTVNECQRIIMNEKNKVKKDSSSSESEEN